MLRVNLINRDIFNWFFIVYSSVVLLNHCHVNGYVWALRNMFNFEFVPFGNVTFLARCLFMIYFLLIDLYTYKGYLVIRLNCFIFWHAGPSIADYTVCVLLVVVVTCDCLNPLPMDLIVWLSFWQSNHISIFHIKQQYVWPCPQSRACHWSMSVIFFSICDLPKR